MRLSVQDEKTAEIVFNGPDSEDVSTLMSKLVESLAAPATGDPFVYAAMAHLNLAMIHPFRNGNGRMTARGRGDWPFSGVQAPRAHVRCNLRRHCG